MFSIVIPTMQGAEELWDLMEIYSDHSLVEEILVVNNSDRPLEKPLPPRAREIYRGPNLFVNPAWNLGAAESRAQILAISNDDILIDPALLDHVAELYRSDSAPGMLGPSRGAVYGHDTAREFGVRPVWEVPAGYGVLFFMRREDYIPIPESMRIYAGEYWLFWNQKRANAEFHGSEIVTEMHTTSGRGEFEAIKVEDVASYEAAMANVLGTRRWHRKAKLHLRAQSLEKSVKARVKRLIPSGDGS